MGALFLLPLVYLFLRAFQDEPARWLSLLLRRRNLTLLLNTLALMAGVLTLSTAFALPLAWFHTRYMLPGGKFWSWLAVLPLTIPGYVMAYSLISLWGPYGLPSRLFDWVWLPLSPYMASVLALSLYSFPYLYLNLRTAFLGMDPALEESARSLGLSPWRTFLKVTLPHMKPAFLSGWLVIALYVLGDFGVVALMRFEVFSYAIFVQYSSAFNRSYASILSLLLLVLTAFLVWSEGRLLGKSRYQRSGIGAARKNKQLRAGLSLWPAWLHSFVVYSLSLGLPALALGYWLLLAPGQTDWGDLMLSFLRSLSAALPTALVTGLAALPLVYLRIRHPSGLSRFLERLAHGAYAMPPLALALALVFLSLGAFPWLYQSLGLLITGYTLNYLALAMGPLRVSLLQASPVLEEAARSLGRSPFQAFRQVTLPLVRRGLLAGMSLVFVMTMKELPITFLLAPTGFSTLAVKVFSRTSEAMLAQAAPYALMVVLTSALFVGLLFQQEGQNRLNDTQGGKE